MGGLSKKAWQFERIIENAQRPFVKVDGGGLLFSQLRLDDFKLQQLQITATGIVQAYNRMAYDAVAVSGRDLAAGLDFLLQLSGDSQFSWLSANLVLKSSGKLAFAPFSEKDIAGLRLAIIGLTGEAALPALVAKKAVIRPWQEILPDMMADLSRRYDFIILLTDYSPAQCAKIGREYPQINLIVDAHGQSDNRLPRRITSTTIQVSTGKQGKYIGAFDVSWSPGGGWGSGENFFGQLKEKEKSVQHLNHQLDLLKASSGAASRVGNLRRKKDIILADIGEINKKRGKAAVSFFTNEFYEMSADIDDDLEIKALVGATKERINEAAGEAGGGNVSPAGFLGWRACGPCHNAKIKKWQRTPHARAYATLVNKKQEFNFNCVPCHVTGIDSKNISQALALVTDFHDVSCEACHGAGQAHAESKGQVGLAVVKAELCLRCHVPEHDDGFDFTADLLKLGCGG